jgi:cytochrome c oxidase assembly factor CtaG
VLAPLLAARDVSVANISGSWHLRPVLVAFVLLAVAVFAPAFARVRRDDPAGAPWTRAALFAAGLAVMVAPLCTPLNAAAERYLLSAHMLEHVLLADAGPALIVLSVRGPIARALAVRLRPVHAVTDVLLRPPVTLVLWALAIGVWHIPALYDRALSSPGLHDLEHATFALAGTLVWVQMIDPAGSGRLGLPGRLAFTVAVFFAGQVLSDALVFSFHPYYPAYSGGHGRLLGLSPLTDQRLAGIVMSVEQLLTLGTCFVLLLRRMRRRDRLGTALIRV